MFSLKKQQVKLIDVNLRAELHGEEPVPAADLKIEMTASNDTLAEFHPTLKWSLYDKNGQDLVDKVNKDSVTKQRYPAMSGFSWDLSLEHQAVKIHVPGSKEDIVFGDCKVDAFRIDPKDGGSVDITFRVQLHPQEKQVGKLHTILKKAVEITLDEDEDAMPEEPKGRGKRRGADSEARA